MNDDEILPRNKQKIHRGRNECEHVQKEVTELQQVTSKYIRSKSHKNAAFP